eukprot:TRINITY_DN9010_c0_g1_i1.p2 TRINITY_DN9010_c0_g1~~TRINITY_DN9010_c0_g1_i1.p2  ORF type:complete len:263 (-),score=103.95 TRINITY_DN9010_c0_g1_i1:1923-2711(-)
MSFSGTGADPSQGWQQRLPTVNLQAEFFLLKFPDVDRTKSMEMADSFKKFDGRGKGELQEDEALRLLESRKETKRVVELRQMVKDMDFDKNRDLCFLEWACAYFNKSWKTLHSPSANQAEVDRAMKKLVEAEEKDRVAKAKLADDEKKKKEEEEKRKADLQNTGIKGAAAKFHYAGTDTADKTKSNEDRIKSEAAARKAEKEKKAAEEEKARVEADSAAAEIKRQQDLKDKAEREQAEKEAAEVERKAKVQAALKAKFGGAK